MKTFDVIIKLKDNTEKVIESVSGYSKDDDCFIVTKNGYRIFFPTENVLYIGRSFDLGK
ncbi:hypothetical protein ACFOZ1_15170 [Gracilibacillus marinus]|uniref:Uncharacterized protein n=1 Tax=Gracilibacillus marinus TaxID=630535 RepID=A0ABV8VX85_9BACI